MIFLLFLFACQLQSEPRIRLFVDGQVLDIAADDLIPRNMLANASITFTPADRVLLNGVPVPLDQLLQPQAQLEIQVRRAVSVTLISPNRQMTFDTAAFTVGEALHATGVSLFVSDRVEPPVQTLITSGMTITMNPGQDMFINTAGQTIRLRTAAGTVGQLLAEAGMPLVGMDYSSPSEIETLPVDGQLRIVRVTEFITSSYGILPYETNLTVTADLQPLAQDILDPGETGISLTRTRIRYKDGTAVVADMGGGFPDDRAWIDLGYSDEGYVGWSRWVTVYFLAPAPLEIPWFLQ